MTTCFDCLIYVQLLDSNPKRFSQYFHEFKLDFLNFELNNFKIENQKYLIFPKILATKELNHF